MNISTIFRLAVLAVSGVLIILWFGGGSLLALQNPHGRLPSTPVLVDSNEGYCGFAAVEFVSRRIGVDLIDSTKLRGLKSSKNASLYDLRTCWRENGVEAASFEIEPYNQKAWDNVEYFIRQGIGQVILLVPTVSGEEGVSEELTESGHFFIVDTVGKEGITLIDPTTTSIFDCSMEDLYRCGKAIAIQTVRSKNSAWYHEHLLFEQHWYTVSVAVLMSMLFAVYFIYRKSSHFKLWLYVIRLYTNNCSATSEIPFSSYSFQCRTR